MKPRNFTAKTPVRMSCGHWQYFSVANSIPAPGDYMFCMQCMQETHRPYPPDLDFEGNPIPGEWRWRCLSKNCRMGRKCGTSQQMAVHQASKHVQQRPQHDIHVIRPNGVIELRLGRDQNALPLFSLNGQVRHSVPF